MIAAVKVRHEIYHQMFSRFERGMVDRRLFLKRTEIANLAADELGETVQDNALGAERINAWLTGYLSAQPVSDG